MPLKAVRCLALGVMALIFPGVGKADLLRDCVSCFGSTYLLTYNPTAVETSGSTNVWDVFLTVDATHYMGPATYIRDVAIKVASPPVESNLSALMAAPGALSSWTLKKGGAGNSDCSNNGNGFLCAQSGTPGTTAPVGFVYTWEFWYATANPLATGPLGASIQIKYDNALGTLNGQITSEKITLQTVPQTVPDGSMTLMLLGGALVGLETQRRRFRA